MKMDKEQAFNLIDECLGPASRDTLVQGLPGGSYAEWDYDEELVIDIGEALAKWKLRSDAGKKAKK